MPNICDNYVCITGAEDVLVVMESRDFHWFDYFPDMEERGRTRMATARGDDAAPIRLIRNASGHAEAYFISAWCPPLEFYNRLVEKYSDIRIEYEYHEWRMGIAGFGIAGRGLQPTHFSYECAEDIEDITSVHSWKLQIENPYTTTEQEGPVSEEEALTQATYSEDETDSGPLPVPRMR